MKTITKSLFVLTIAFCFVTGAGQDEAFGQRKGSKRRGKSVSKKQIKLRGSRPSKKVSPQLGKKKNQSLKKQVRPQFSQGPRGQRMRQVQQSGINGNNTTGVTIQGSTVSGNRVQMRRANFGQAYSGRMRGSKSVNANKFDGSDVGLGGTDVHTPFPKKNFSILDNGSGSADVTISGGDLSGNMTTFGGHTTIGNSMDKSTTTLAGAVQTGSNGLFTRPVNGTSNDTSTRFHIDGPFLSGTIR